MILASASAVAQERFGELYGVVQDASQAVLPNASITITNKESGRQAAVSSVADGSWSVPGLESGHYKVRVEAKGFQAYELPDVNLVVGKRLRVDSTLAIGATSETVQVTEQAPLIDFSGTTIAHNVTAEEFDRLPKPRSFQQLALASPSVNSGDIEGGFQVNGASGAENQFNIDGVSTTSLVNGKSRQNAVFEILQEVQVKTAGIDAEHGGALGGVISAITKSGGNAFHGDFHYYLSGNDLNAAPVKRLLLDPSTELTARFVQDGKFKDRNQEIGGSLGGYFIKNKLWFFGAMSPRFRSRENDYVFSGNTPGKLHNDQTYQMGFGKLSWDPTSRIRTNLTYLWSPTRSTGRLPSYNADSSGSTLTLASAAPNEKIGYSSPQSSYTGQVDFTTSATTLLTIRAGRFWDDYKTTGIPGVSAVEYATTGQNLPFDIPAALRQGVGFSNTPRQTNTYFDLTTRTYFQADFSKFGRLLGQHNLKIGAGRSKTVNRVNTAYPGGGYVRIFWNSTLSTRNGPQRGQYGYYEVNDLGTRGSTGAAMNNFYFQDQWRIIPRLTLSLGLRLENETVPSFRRDIRDTAFSFGYGDKIAPRLGASFDLFGDGRVKLYGSYGLYYDWVKYELSRGTFGGDFWRTYYRSLDTLDVFSISGTNLPGRNIWVSDFRDRRVPSFDAIAPGIKPMSQRNINAGVEYQLRPQTVLRVGFVRNDLRRTIEDLGALNANGDEVYLYANPGEGTALVNPTTGLTKPFPTPRPTRTYTAMEVTLTRRFAQGYFASASYVLSRLYGNYAGLANSDELTSPSTGLSSSTSQQQEGSIGRQGGNGNRSWDLDEVLFDSHGTLNFMGRLATDRPHVFKLYGAKTFKTGTEAGLFFYGGSGTPQSTNVWTLNHIPVFVEGRGNMGRSPILTQTDLLVSQEVKLGETKRLRFEFNMQNLFNQKTARNLFNALNRGVRGTRDSSAIDLSKIDLAKGYDYRALIGATPDAKLPITALDPRYGMADIFNPGFAGRLGLKFIF